MAEVSEMRRARLVVAYRGTDFRGFAANEGVRTVMGEITVAIERIVRRRVELVGAGRTDAGVHGWGQVVSGDLPAEVDLDDLARRVSQICAPDIAVRSAEWTDDDFDARFSATSRRYRYHVWNDPAPHPLLAEYVWHVVRPLDLDAMEHAAHHLVGEHDFTSFCRQPKLRNDMVPPSMVRIVHRASWRRVGGSLLRFEVAASAFCHQMVRSLVGTTVDVGLGRLRSGTIPDVIAARDRAAAGRVAPPRGLVLWEVGYDGRRWDAGAAR